MKPYYEDSAVTIYHGDCREILPGLGKVDLVLTDPPYGNAIDTAYRSKRPKSPFAKDYDSVFGNDEPFDPSHLLAIADAEILWGANNYADKLPCSPMWLVWDRESRTDATQCELAWVRGHRFKTVSIFRHLWTGWWRASERGFSVHPTQKPIELMHWSLSFFPEATTVIDPYMGSGPTLRAAKDLGRKAIGIEIEERYCEIAARRMEQEVLPLNAVQEAPAPEELALAI